MVQTDVIAFAKIGCQKGQNDGVQRMGSGFDVVLGFGILHITYSVFLSQICAHILNFGSCHSRDFPLCSRYR